VRIFQEGYIQAVRIFQEEEYPRKEYIGSKDLSEKKTPVQTIEAARTFRYKIFRQHNNLPVKNIQAVRTYASKKNLQSVRTFQWDTFSRMDMPVSMNIPVRSIHTGRTGRTCQ
jgi:hypothetical protein